MCYCLDYLKIALKLIDSINNIMIAGSLILIASAVFGGDGEDTKINPDVMKSMYS